MFPPRFPYPEEALRGAERRFFRACESQLDDTWIVLYELHWHGIRRGKNRDGEADFLMMSPLFGIFVVEVKGGQAIEVEDGVWYSTPHGASARVEVKNPFSQVNESKRVILDWIRENVQDITLPGVFGHMVAFPGHSQKGDIATYGRRELICDKQDLSRLSEKMKSLATYLKLENVPNPNDLWKIKRALLPSFRLFGTSRAELDDNIDDLNRLTDEQLRSFSMLRTFEELTVYGSAGTGKTVLAFNRAKELAASKHWTLFLCSNTNLAIHLRNDLKESAFDSRYLGIYSQSEFFMKFTKDFLSQGGLGDNQRVSRGEMEQFCLETATQHGNLFDALVVDEAQSFASTNLDIVGLFLKHDAKRYLFGDGVQAIPMGWTSALDDPRLEWLFDTVHESGHTWLEGAGTVKLTVNCRNTERIGRFANSFTSNEIEIYGPRGRPVEVGSAPMVHWGERIREILLRWKLEYGVCQPDVKVLFDDFSFLDALCQCPDEFPGLTNFGDASCPVGVSRVEDLFIDWLGSLSFAKAARLLSLSNRFRKFARDHGISFESLLGGNRDLVSENYGRWLAQAASAEGIRSGTKEYGEFEVRWPLTKSQLDSFLLHREDFFKVNLGERVTPIRIADFTGLEAEAVIALLTPGTDLSYFQSCVYTMLSRPRVLLAVVCERDAVTTLARGNRSRLKQFQILFKGLRD